MNVLYSPSKNLFYIEDWNYSDIPKDIIPIEESVFLIYSNDPPIGKKRVSGKGGMPMWGDIAKPTRDDIIESANYEKLQLLKLSDEKMRPLIYSDELDMSTAEELAQLKAWKKYRVLLNRVDTNSAPDIEWPVIPD